MTNVCFGTAHLFGLVDPERSRVILSAALTAGIRRFDTAPSYGGGRSEEELAGLITRSAQSVRVELVSTKVGIAPPVGPAGARSFAKRVAGLLPAPVTERLRGASLGATHGRFGVDEVRASVDRSLTRLGHIDRLLLHEVDASDITDPLLDVLRGYLAAGDVGAVGVATQNHLTGPALAMAPELFTVAHADIGPLAPPVTWPDHVTARVGHGVLGAGGADLRALRAVLAREPDLRARWTAAVAGSGDGTDPLVDALLLRAGAAGVTDLILATSRPEAIGPSAALMARDDGPPGPVSAVLEELVSRCERR